MKSLLLSWLIPELIYRVVSSHQGPIHYSFTYGGKDGIPYPVDRKIYNQSIELLRRAINRNNLGIKEKNEAAEENKNIISITILITFARELQILECCPAQY